MLRKISMALLFCCSFGFFSLAGFSFLQREAEAKQLEQLANTKETILINNVSTEPTEQNEQNEQNKASMIDFGALKEINQDITGWITIQETLVDYPIMYTPEDVEHYLRKDVEGEYSVSGVPFVGYNSSLDPVSDNLVIYSHNMRNGTMFSTVLNYSSEQYLNDHKYIDIYVDGALYTYEVIAYFNIDVTIGNGHFEYYKYIDFDYANMAEYNDKLADLSMHSIETPIVKSDKVLTLSTCSDNSQNGRSVLVAKLIQ